MDKIRMRSYEEVNPLPNLSGVLFSNDSYHASEVTTYKNACEVKRKGVVCEAMASGYTQPYSSLMNSSDAHNACAVGDESDEESTCSHDEVKHKENEVVTESQPREAFHAEEEFLQQLNLQSAFSPKSNPQPHASASKPKTRSVSTSRLKLCGKQTKQNVKKVEGNARRKNKNAKQRKKGNTLEEKIAQLKQKSAESRVSAASNYSFCNRSKSKEARENADDDSKEVCKICRVVYTSEDDKLKHVNTSSHHLQHEAQRGTNEQALAQEGALLADVMATLPVTCPACQRQITKRREFLVHHRREHSGLRPFSCPRCSDVDFFRRCDLLQHLRCQHLGESSFRCDVCQACFGQRDKLLAHLVSKHRHADTRPRNFKCTECSEAFMSKAAVDQHMLTHTGYRPYTCLVCRRGFRTNTALVVHQRTHTGEKPHKCEECEFSTRTQQLLDRHRRKHTGVRPYRCDTCSFSATTSGALKRHTNQHTGEKPFKCPYCTHRCTNLENLRKHVMKTKQHTGLKVYPCRHCVYSTDDAAEYVKHVKEQHNPYLADHQAATKLAGITSDDDDVTTSGDTPHDVTREDLSTDGKGVVMLVPRDQHDDHVATTGTRNVNSLDVGLLNVLIKIPNLQKVILPQGDGNGPVTLVIGSDVADPSTLEDDGGDNVAGNTHNATADPDDVIYVVRPPQK